MDVFLTPSSLHNQKADPQNYVLLNDLEGKSILVSPNTKVYILHIWSMSCCRNKQLLTEKSL